MPLLAKFASPKLLLGAGSFVVIAFLLWRNDHLATQRDISRDQLAALQLQYDSTVEQYENIITEMSAVAERQQERAASSRVIEEDIRNALPEEDGVVAPVLRNTIDRLRERSTSTD